MTAPAPFLSWLNEKTAGAKWVVSPRLTMRLKVKGYTLALSQERYTALQNEWQALADRNRTERIALRLFPDDYFDGHDCRSEIGREGQPCRICADNLERWTGRIQFRRRRFGDRKIGPAAKKMPPDVTLHA